MPRNVLAVLAMTMALTMASGSASENTSSALSESAELAILRYAVIVEAEVLSSHVVTVDKKVGRCQWMTQLQLLPSQVIWGRAESNSFNIFTHRLPEQMLREGYQFPNRDVNCVVQINSGHNPSPIPTAGQKGIFHLYDVDAVFGERLLLGRFLPIDSENFVVIRDHASRPAREWPYDVYLTVLERAASEHSIRALRDAPVMLRGVVGPPGSATTQENVLRLPLSVDQVYKGRVASTEVFLVLDQTSITDRLISMHLSPLLSKQVLVFGRLHDGTELVAKRVFAISEGDTVSLPFAVETPEGGFARTRLTLAELREMTE